MILIVLIVLTCIIFLKISSYYYLQKTLFNNGQQTYSSDHNCCKHVRGIDICINPPGYGDDSCIYKTLDPNSDGVLPDWQLTLRKFGKTRFKSPPLDSEIFEFSKGYKHCAFN